MNVLTNKTVRGMLVVLLSAVLVFTGFAFDTNSSAYAAPTGTSSSSAVKMTLDSDYMKAWTKGNQHLNHYSTFTIPERGIVTLTATKPYDDEGEFGRMEFILYDGYGEVVWGSDSYYTVDGFFDFYQYKIGLNAGTYFLSLRPEFTVKSGSIETTYSASFTANPYCELEPNEGLASATSMVLGQVYSGSYGKDGFDNSGEHDVYKVELTKGTTYKIALGNYSKLDATSLILDFYGPADTDESLMYDMENKVDENGRNYALFKAPASGTYYIDFNNYMQAPIDYTLGVSEMVKEKQTISGKKTFNKVNDCENFMLNQEAEGELTYSSSNRDVVSVYSDGEVHVWGPGKATITVKAAETDTHKAATKKITITVKPKKPTFKSLKNISSRKLVVEWDNPDYDAERIQIQVATNKTFTKNVKNYYMDDSYPYNKTISKLKKGTTYYVRVRSYVKIGETNYYSAWTNYKYKKVTK